MDLSESSLERWEYQCRERRAEIHFPANFWVLIEILQVFAASVC